MKKIIILIKETLDSIPIFFREEKEHILKKIEGKSDKDLEEIYTEIINIEKEVKEDLTKLQKKVKKIEDNIKVKIEERKSKTIKRLIQEAEERDNEIN